MKKDEKELKKEQVEDTALKEKKGHENPEEQADEKGHENPERDAFDEEKKAYLSEKQEFEAARALAQEDMPVSFAKLLAGSDSEATKENVVLFKKEFMKALEKALSERLKGNVPRTGTTDMYENDPFLAGFGM